MVGIEILIRVEDRKRAEFLQAAGMLCAEHEGAGSLRCGAFEDVGDPGRFLWVEQWANRELLDAHLGSEQHRALLGAIRVLGQLESVRLVEFGPGDGAA